MRYIHVILLACLTFLSATTFASAFGHSFKSAQTTGGVILSPMIHEQIEPIWKNHAAIATLANTALADSNWTGPERDTFLDVYNYGHGAYLSTWWGWAPGDVLNSDANPWHWPTHVYVRADFWMLEALHKAYPANAEVAALYDRLNDETNGLMGVCRYSYTAMSITEPAGADWSLIRPQLQFAGACAAAALFSACMVLLVRRSSRRVVSV